MPSRLRRPVVLLALALLAAGLAATLVTPAHAQDGAEGRGSIDILPIRGALDPPAVAAIEDLVTGAPARESRLIVLQLETSGGLAVDASSVLTTVADSPVPVVAYAGPAFARARVEGLGVLLLAVADLAAAAPDATIGPASPVDRAEDAPGRDRELLAEALSQRDVQGDALDAAVAAVVDGTVSAEDAQALDLVDLLAGGLDGLLTELDGRTVATPEGSATLALADLDVKLHSLGLVRRALHASTTASFVYLMLVVGLALLLFELFQPGFGVAGVAAVVVLLLAVYGMIVLPVAWWAVALLVAGLGLLAADTAIAGLGIPTAAGAVSLTLGSMFLYTSPHLGVPGWLIALMVASAVAFFVVVLTIVLRAQAGPDPSGIEDVVGARGVVRSALNPEGHVFADGALWRARFAPTGPGSEHRGKIGVGTVVRIHGVDGAVVLVDLEDAGGGGPQGEGSPETGPLASGSGDIASSKH